MKNIGIIAGNGRFPFLAAQEITKSGDRVVAVALQDETNPSLEKYVDSLIWLPLGKLQKIIDFFKKENVTEAVMAGQVKHAKLFSALHLDLRAIKLLARVTNKKADSILGAVADDLAKEGITLLPSHHLLKHLLPPAGVLAGPKPTAEEKKDIAFGHEIAKKIAGLDIGQTVVVKDKCVLAVESIEGTNECIRRAATLGKEGIVVVKVAKPNQDWRFDIPVIGPDTITTLADVKASLIAIDAGMTLMLDKEELIALANKHKITVIAV